MTTENALASALDDFAALTPDAPAGAVVAIAERVRRVIGFASPSTLDEALDIVEAGARRLSVARATLALFV